MWSKLIDVIDADGRQANIRRIEPAAESDFQYGRVCLCFDEMQQCHCRRDFEIGRAAVRIAFGRGFFIHRADDWDHRLTSATSSSAEHGWPSTANRSSIRSKCGELNRPVRKPAAVSIAAIMAEVEPLPLVPATWTIFMPASGWPRRVRSWRMRSSLSCRSW